LLKGHTSCDTRNRPYKNGKTFEDCRAEARRITSVLSEEILLNNEVSWKKILELAGHNELVYKLTLKYLREMGYDIGNYTIPRVVRRIETKTS
jgi:hypothetical protein